MKSSNNSTDIDKELREAIITDLIINANKELDNVVGILVTGDIAFSGTTIEYENAKTYLNEISKIFSIDPSDIYCVPGNHDVNRATVTNSAIISQAQSVIDESKCVDSADEAFSKTLTDTLFNNVLFEPIREYNEFANRFNCSITPERITWSSDFDLEYELKLRLFGINSCYLSSSHDNLVYVGQAQIPPREPDTVVLLMCHHPPGCWKFKDDIIVRINKRADIQLYGHIHMQSVELTNSNAILFSGATHPQRAEDWYPRYNWITISSEKINGDRYLRIEIYPRILSDDRDHFKADEGNTTNGISLQHLINIDEKRRSDLVDSCQELNGSTNPSLENDPVDTVETTIDIQPEINERELIYNFFELPVIRQMELLGKLELISENDKGKSITTVLNNSIQRAKEKGKLKSLNDFVNEYVTQKEEM